MNFEWNLFQFTSRDCLLLSKVSRTVSPSAPASLFSQCWMAVKFMLPDHHDTSSDTQGQIVGRRGNWSGVLLSPQSAPRSAPRSPRLIVMRTFAHVRMQYRSSESWNASRARSRSPTDAFPVASAFSFVVPFVALFAFAPHTQGNASARSGTQRVLAQTRSGANAFHGSDYY